MSALGITSQEAEIRLRQHGPNLIAQGGKRSLLSLAWDVIREPMLLLLITAGIISFFLADLVDAALLMVTVLIVLAIAILQERRSERAIEALRDLTAPLALVVRDGTERRVPSTQVVLGDLLVLLEGDRVAADARLITSSALSIDESLLTGESTPVAKERDSQVLAGSLVLRGHGRALVTAISAESEIGKIGRSITEIPFERTRLQRGIDRLVRVVGILGLVTVISIILAYGLTRGEWLEAALAGIAAAMALIPEEFPVILTLFFALGAWRMAQVRVIARKSAAIEALGAITVLCVDKTGTLTLNQMEVESLQIDHAVHNLGSAPIPSEFQEVARIAALAAPRVAYDPMDRAFQSITSDFLDLDEYESLKEYPVELARLGYIHIWQNRGVRIAALKGAPEYVGELCGMTLSDRTKLDREVSIAARSGRRVIAIARAELLEDVDLGIEGLNFEFLGIAILQDPIRTGVPEAVASCRSAGIRTVMITGDHPETAMAIARQIELANPESCLTGTEIMRLSDDELAERVRDCSIFARVRPEHKLRLIRILQREGEVVAMTGDGVNDAPALRAADIGIAMGGRGTDVAREAAALVITDDNFTSIVAGIRRGRAIYANMQKAMSYVIAIHVPIFGMALVPVFVLDWPLVLLPALVAFHEVIIDPACSIVFEVEEPDPQIMERKPRPVTASIFNRAEVALAFLQGFSVFIAVFSTFLAAQFQGLGDSETRTLSFATLMISNLALIMANRSRTLTIFGSAFSRRNRVLPWILLLGIGVLLTLIYVPFLSTAFDLTPLTLSQFLQVTLVAYAGVAWLDIVKIRERIKARQ